MNTKTPTINAFFPKEKSLIHNKKKLQVLYVGLTKDMASHSYAEGGLLTRKPRYFLFGLVPHILPRSMFQEAPLFIMLAIKQVA